ncbi:dipeptide/oligopeptide/nickel ABC transporter ATP-binding protein [Bombiscardovia apis]|uniref:Dipeptide/oligopeptide/nickel ABC transporter ATP-binding protein n=1 Tax=Bombiscardovia apis TaxID=2932182 RepID=A0ABN6SG43_9BIFI|nr:ATP-binding cassette domain-containing protein [Bombiscardovia apis]BDR54972.1 dipeptide/oligopeptide/nickel ABC transporter ATP-binding protein [Bombiscardovia apis]
MKEPAVALIEGQDICKSFGHGRQSRLVLDRVSVAVNQGSCLAVVGGSGSGKSTLIRILLGLESLDAGSVCYDGLPLEGPTSAGYRALRRQASLVFQNPFASLDPRWPALRSVGEPLRIQAKQLGLGSESIRQRSLDALEAVGLDPAQFADRFPADCSGGQAQRIAIARALVTSPRLLVADEPMSSLDVSARLSVLETFNTIRQARPETAIIIVSHDLGIVQHMAERILVLEEGHMTEEGPTRQVLTQPRSPYTRSLIAAASL